MKFKSDQTGQKLRGGYYTPQDIADYVTSWVLGCSPKSILEPSCGDGVFIQAIHNNKYRKKIDISAFELFDTEVKKSRALCRKLKIPNFKVSEGDFLLWANKQIDANAQLFDVVIGNPPFIRYQFLEKDFQENMEKTFNLLNLKFTKHTNAWVPFILSSIALLRPNGRFGMVIPSEIINVIHAQPLREFLIKECRKIVVVDPKEIWFEDTLQGAVILFAEKKERIEEKSQGVGIEYVVGSDFLNKCPEQLFSKAYSINGRDSGGKWTKSTLSDNELSLLDKVCRKKTVYSFSDIATVDVGIVTGANKFFLVDDQTIKDNGLKKYAHPMFGRSEHCKGVLYNDKQHAQNKENGHPTNFVYLEGALKSFPKKVKEYIAKGEKDKLHKRYKCSVREPWYTVPSVYSTEIGMLKRSHNAPRLIFNDIGAYTTDTAYRITTELNAKKLVYCFINPLTAIYAELEGRYYGGGVLEMVPSEIEKLVIPIPKTIDVDLKELDKMVRSLPMEEVLLQQGYKVLGAIGLPKKEVKRLVEIWIYLKNRRQRN